MDSWERHPVLRLRRVYGNQFRVRLSNYLRDNMKMEAEKQVAEGPPFVNRDEVDSILID